jgi:hypothetical protein
MLLCPEDSWIQGEKHPKSGPAPWNPDGIEFRIIDSCLIIAYIECRGDK